MHQHLKFLHIYYLESSQLIFQGNKAFSYFVMTESSHHSDMASNSLTQFDFIEKSERIKFNDLYFQLHLVTKYWWFLEYSPFLSQDKIGSWYMISLKEMTVSFLFVLLFFYFGILLLWWWCLVQLLLLFLLLKTQNTRLSIRVFLRNKNIYRIADQSSVIRMVVTIEQRQI